MMKYFLAIALIATVASAAVVRPTPVSAEIAEIQEIIAAINSPSTDPATAAALEQMLFDVLGVKPEPVVVSPTLVEDDAVPSPVVVGPVPAASTPLVQIILNIKQAESSPITVGPVVTPEVVEEAPIAVNPIGVVRPEPVQVVDPALITPPIAVNPIGVVAPTTPVQVIETAPVAVEPVLVGVPVIPEEFNRRGTQASAASTPLVQIILNINQAVESSPITTPVVAPEVVEEAPIAVNPIGVVRPEPVLVVDPALITPPIAVNPIGVVRPEPVQVVDPALITPPIAVNPIGVVAPVTPVQVVETAPVAVEPVLIGVPVLPEELN